jgi:hypothetical protein
MARQRKRSYHRHRITGYVCPLKSHLMPCPSCLSFSHLMPPTPGQLMRPTWPGTPLYMQPLTPCALKGPISGGYPPAPRSAILVVRGDVSQTFTVLSVVVSNADQWFVAIGPFSTHTLMIATTRFRRSAPRLLLSQPLSHAAIAPLLGSTAT